MDEHSFQTPPAYPRQENTVREAQEAPDVAPWDIEARQAQERLSVIQSDAERTIAELEGRCRALAETLSLAQIELTAERARLEVLTNPVEPILSP